MSRSLKRRCAQASGKHERDCDWRASKIMARSPNGNAWYRARSHLLRRLRRSLLGAARCQFLPSRTRPPVAMPTFRAPVGQRGPCCRPHC
jgi:hypothetical protein